jgi:hypothetical protein
MAANTNFQEQFAQLLEACNGDVSQIAKAVKAVTKKSNKKYDVLRVALEQAAKDTKGKVACKRFRAEALAAWKRVYPDSEAAAAATRPLNNYQQYVKTNLKSIKDMYPDMSHTEHLRFLTQQWNVHKASLNVNRDAEESQSQQHSGEQTSEEVVDTVEEQDDDMSHVQPTPKKARVTRRRRD